MSNYVSESNRLTCFDLERLQVVDSRARSGADGNLQQAARRKLEVFQSQVPGGRIQVIKTQTVSSSRWSSQGITNSTPKDNNQDVFEDLKVIIKNALM